MKLKVNIDNIKDAMRINLSSSACFYYLNYLKSYPFEPFYDNISWQEVSREMFGDWLDHPFSWY